MVGCSERPAGPAKDGCDDEARARAMRFIASKFGLLPDARLEKTYREYVFSTTIRGMEIMNERIDVLAGSVKDFRDLKHISPIRKAEVYARWMNARVEAKVWPFRKQLLTAPKSHASVRMPEGGIVHGLNFSSQDYLSLSTHPQVIASAHEAIDRFGLHSAGSPALTGNLGDGESLEREIADHLQTPFVTLFPTGWSAGFGIIKALVRQADHVVIDALAHNCLHEGTRASTGNIHMFKHLDHGHARELLAAIRARDSENGILLISEGVYSMDADSPDIAAMQALASEFNAIFVLDVAHDLGCSGPDGTGHLGIQGMLGKVDIVMGAFSKTFASNGGFVATHHRAINDYLTMYSPPHTFSNAMSPIQIAIVRQCLRIVRSGEGEQLRSSLFRAVGALRAGLSDGGLFVYGAPSAIVPVLLGSDSHSRLAYSMMADNNLLVNLVEFPAVAANTARLRLQVMANHAPEECEEAAAIIVECVRACDPSKPASLDMLRQPAFA